MRHQFAALCQRSGLKSVATSNFRLPVRPMVIIRPGPSSPATNTYAITGCSQGDRPNGKGLSTLVIDPSKRSSS
jgi:hypothetical protein